MAVLAVVQQRNTKPVLLQRRPPLRGTLEPRDVPGRVAMRGTADRAVLRRERASFSMSERATE